MHKLLQQPNYYMEASPIWLCTRPYRKERVVVQALPLLQGGLRVVFGVKGGKHSRLLAYCSAHVETFVGCEGNRPGPGCQHAGRHYLLSAGSRFFCTGVGGGVLTLLFSSEA